MEEPIITEIPQDERDKAEIAHLTERVKILQERHDLHKECIAKKSCAAEVHNYLKVFKLYLIGNMVAAFVICISSIFGLVAASVTVGVAVILNGLYCRKIMDKLSYLESTYKFR